MSPRVTLACAVLGLLGACRGQPSSDPPIVPIRNMYHQPRYDAQEATEFFADGRTMRPAIDGTVPQEAPPSLEVARGRLADDTDWVATIPDDAMVNVDGSRATLAGFAARGRGRYEIYCAPCHASVGDGSGMIVERGMIAPPSLHDERIRTMPDGQLFATISNGIRNMPAYAHSIPTRDRWAIVAYVRALELQQASRAQAMNTTEYARVR